MASAPKVVQATAVQAVVDALTDGIRDGRFVPGQRLVEGDLTAELGVSRGPLREALGRLAAEGLVEIEPYRGAMVRRLTRDDIVDLFGVREVLEAEAARLAAVHIDDGTNRKRLRDAIKAVDRYKGGPDTLLYMDENQRFHELILELSGNRMLAKIVTQLQVHAFRLLFRRLVDAGAKDNSIAEHDAVAAAILAGDARTAERAMRNHVRRSGEMVLQRI